MKNTKLIIMLTAGLVLIVGVVLFQQTSASSNASASSLDWQTVTDDELSIGNPDASVIIIEYVDLQCPACYQFHQVLSSSWRIIKDDVKVVFRHYPLPHIHPHATKAAEYVEAAKKQGKGYELLDSIVSGQRSWERKSQGQAFLTFENYAKSLGLDVEKLKKDAATSKVIDLGKRYLSHGDAVPIRGTPTIAINGKVVPTPADGKKLYSLVQEAKQAARK